LQHRGTGVDAGDFCLRMKAEQLGEEAAVAFAENEDTRRPPDFIEEGRAALLQSSTGAATFDPVVVGRDAVEAHAARDSQRDG
jgi:hypothetical protein